MLDTTATASCTALMMKSLDGRVSATVSRTLVFAAAHQGGSVTKVASATPVPGGRCWRHWRTRAHMLKAEATGPSVPAIMGKADEANHQRLRISGSAERRRPFADRAIPGVEVSIVVSKTSPPDKVGLVAGETGRARALDGDSQLAMVHGGGGADGVGRRRTSRRRGMSREAAVLEAEQSRKERRRGRLRTTGVGWRRGIDAGPAAVTGSLGTRSGTGIGW